MFRPGKRAILALEDGKVFHGLSLGAEGEAFGEVCFNTSMTGYQEILTDPSYRGQMVAMTYPLIGNYGVNSEDEESAAPHLAGFIIKEESRVDSNFRSQGSLSDYLKKHHVVGISEIDTRALVRHLRDQGVLRGVISTERTDPDALVAAALNSPGLVGRDLAREVMPSEVTEWKEPLHALASLDHTSKPSSSFHIVCLDFGMKRNICRHLVQRGNRVTIVPGTTSASEILGWKPQGLFLSNGPGDPEAIEYAIQTIRELLGQLPIFGICLGHQLLSLACGAKTFKMKFGHRGANQPVLHLATGRVEVTTQNHGFAVEEASLPATLEVTHRHLNDQTIAGIRHRTYPAFSVQYHPEASAGPHDSGYLFDQFQELLQQSTLRAS